MGMSLMPSESNQPLIFNWAGWQYVCEFADRHGVNTNYFDGLNDGKKIPKWVCLQMAEAIEENRKEYDEAFAGDSYGQDPATEHARIWRESGGFRQY